MAATVARKQSVPSPQITQARMPGLISTTVRRDEITEFHVTVTPLPGDNLEKIASRLREFLTASKARLVRQEVWAPIKFQAEFFKKTARRFRDLNWPVIWAEGLPREGDFLSGVHALAIAGAEPVPIYERNRAVGCVFSDRSARYCVLGGILPSSGAISRPGQARQVFQSIARHLSSVDMQLTDLARTWLFLDDILGWYAPFNEVRREVFEQHGVFNRFMPASTGIGARNPEGRALVAGAWAVQPISPKLARVRPVESPLQCSARDYGSCFSRAVEIDAPDHRRLFVSGTASISPDGATEYVGDVRKQTARTMEVVRAILTSRGMDWADVTRATVYLKSAGDSWAFTEYCLENGLDLPALLTQASVCRQELLFEIEVDAISSSAVSDWSI